jgi:hypothetical protein
MRTKVLLSLAAFAVSAFAAYAQSNVYSVNIVGFVNQPLVAGQLKLVHNPLDNGTNTMNSVYSALPSGSAAYVWNGAGYSTATKPKAVWSPDLPVPTGTGLFISSPSAVTNTYVGEVLAGPGESTTNVLTGVLTATGALLPYAGTLNSTNGLGLVGAPSGSVLYQYNGAGYNTATKPKAIWSPDLSIGVGEAVFIQSTYNWVQSLPAN